MVVPSELNACAKVNRLLAVRRLAQHGNQRIRNHLDGGDAGRQHEQRQQKQAEQAVR